MCFRLWEGGFESSNNNEMVATGVTATTNITHTVITMDGGTMVKPSYEATINLSLLATFVTFATFLSHPIIGKE